MYYGMAHPEPRCIGGECPKRNTCEHALTPVWESYKIYPVKADEYCGYYSEQGQSVDTTITKY